MGLSGWMVWSHFIFFSFTFFFSLLYCAIVVLVTLPGPYRHISVEMDFAVLNISVCCPSDIVRGDQGFLALQGVLLGVLLCGTFLL